MASFNLMIVMNYIYDKYHTIILLTLYKLHIYCFNNQITLTCTFILLYLH